MAIYALVARHHAYYIIGPFADRDALLEWGHVERVKRDDPRWQEIHLDQPTLLPMLRGPDYHPPPDKEPFPWEESK